MPFGIILLLLSFPAFAELQLQSFQAGLIEKRVVTLEDNERLVGAGSETVTETRQIPAKLGVTFGIQFALAGKNHAGGNQVKYFYLTPGVVDPDGSRHDKYEIVQVLSPAAPYHTMAFQFTERHEVVPGEWQMMIFEGDRLLLKESFAVGIDEETLSAPPAVQPKTLNSVIDRVESAGGGASH